MSKQKKNSYKKKSCSQKGTIKSFGLGRKPVRSYRNPHWFSSLVHEDKGLTHSEDQRSRDTQPSTSNITSWGTPDNSIYVIIQPKREYLTRKALMDLKQACTQQKHFKVIKAKWFLSNLKTEQVLYSSLLQFIFIQRQIHYTGIIF